MCLQLFDPSVSQTILKLNHDHDATRTDNDKQLVQKGKDRRTVIQPTDTLKRNLPSCQLKTGSRQGLPVEGDRESLSRTETDKRFPDSHTFHINAFARDSRRDGTRWLWNVAISEKGLFKPAASTDRKCDSFERREPLLSQRRPIEYRNRTTTYLCSAEENMFKLHQKSAKMWNIAPAT